MIKQHEAVIQAMRAHGGYATLGHLNHAALQVPGSSWGTKTPFASIRRIVLQRPEFFKIKPGLWGLEEARATIEKRFALGVQSTSQARDASDHYYYQGLLVELGNVRGLKTFVPHQDKNRQYLNTTLAQVCTLETFPKFTYDHVLDKAKMIDVTWFNERQMPSEVFEVEHTTPFDGAFLRFMEMQDFAVKFNIVAASARYEEYKTRIAASAFSSIRARIAFVDYEKLSDFHTKAMASAQAENALRLFG